MTPIEAGTRTPRDLLTVREAAERLRISTAGVRRLVQAGKLKHTRVSLGGRRILLFADDLERHIEDCSVEGDANIDLSNLKYIKVDPVCRLPASPSRGRRTTRNPEHDGR